MKEKVRKEVEKLIKEFKTNLSIWTCSVESVEEFKDKVNWLHFSCTQKFSEEFIREFQDKVKWYYVSCRQKLSEEFIREFRDKVNWEMVSKYQQFSEYFMHDFKDKLDIDVLIERNIITRKRLKELEYKNKIHNRFEILDL